MSSKSDDKEPKAALVAAPVKRVMPKGRPFQKGASGNPGGRPTRELEKVRAAARAAGPEAIEKLVHLMRTATPKVAFLACEALLARGFGRPAMTLEASDGSTVATMGGIIFLPALQPEHKAGDGE